MYQDGHLNGFARVLFNNGGYYIGMYKDHKKEGQGKEVYESGRVEEGLWANNQYTGQ